MDRAGRSEYVYAWGDPGQDAAATVGVDQVKLALLLPQQMAIASRMLRGMTRRSSARAGVVLLWIRRVPPMWLSRDSMQSMGARL
jgi:hypothetical protein